MEEINVKKKHLLKGKVISKNMSKTSTVLFERAFMDKKVKKIVIKKKKFHVHDPLESAQVGDEVFFYEGPHISKIKYMHLYAIAQNRKEQNNVEGL